MSSCSVRNINAPKENPVVSTHTWRDQTDPNVGISVVWTYHYNSRDANSSGVNKVIWNPCGVHTGQWEWNIPASCFNMSGYSLRTNMCHIKPPPRMSSKQNPVRYFEQWTELRPPKIGPTQSQRFTEADSVMKGWNTPDETHPAEWGRQRGAVSVHVMTENSWMHVSVLSYLKCWRPQSLCRGESRNKPCWSWASMWRIRREQAVMDSHHPPLVWLTDTMPCHDSVLIGLQTLVVSTDRFFLNHEVLFKADVWHLGKTVMCWIISWLK